MFYVLFFLAKKTNPEATGTSAPCSGLEPARPALEGKALTPGPPGKTQLFSLDTLLLGTQASWLCFIWFHVVYQRHQPCDFRIRSATSSILGPQGQPWSLLLPSVLAELDTDTLIAMCALCLGIAISDLAFSRQEESPDLHRLTQELG